MRREIPWAPPYLIDKQGRVFLDGKPVPPEVRAGAYQPRLTVQIGQAWMTVEELLCNVWYRSLMLVPRDGCVLNLREENLIPLNKLPKLSEVTPQKIHWAWTNYQKFGHPVHRLAEMTGFHHWTTADFTNLITDILIAGIRK